MTSRRERRLQRIDLDNLPPDLYPGFDAERQQLKLDLANRGIDPKEAWRFAYLEADKNPDCWLKPGRKGIPCRARKAMKTLLKFA